MVLIPRDVPDDSVRLHHLPDDGRSLPEEANEHQSAADTTGSPTGREMLEGAELQKIGRGYPPAGVGEGKKINYER